MQITKRNGRLVEFNMEKIHNALSKAFEAVHKTYNIRALVDTREQKFIELGSVELIQDELENILLETKNFDVYRAFSQYRIKRTELREKKQIADIRSIVNAEINDITTDNANMCAQSPAGMMMKFAAELSKSFTKSQLLSKEALKASNDNYIYIHDLDYYPTKSLTCVQTPLDKLLQNGLYAGHGAIRPAKRIETAAVVAAISMETTQNEQHGGQSIPAFDFYLAPYVKLTYYEELNKMADVLAWSCSKEDEYKSLTIQDYNWAAPCNKDLPHPVKMCLKRTVDRVYQAMESFIHNCNNIHSRGGNQVVFSSINYGTDTSPEGRLIIKELLKCTYEGVGKGSTAIFPIHVFKCKSGVNKNEGDPNYDLYKQSWKVAARRFFPNYLNLDSSFNKDENWDVNDPLRYIHEVATMGCRTRIYDNMFAEKSSIGRGNLSFTSINLPKLGIETAIESHFLVPKEGGYEINQSCETDLPTRLNLFKAKLKKIVTIVAKQLYERYLFQASALKSQFPLLMSGVWLDSEKLKKSDVVKEVLKHGTLGISFIGLAECLIALTGKHHGESGEAQNIGLDIVEYLSNLCHKFSEKYQLNFSCFATPAEGLSGRFTKIDFAKYGSIEHITDKDYYTNSSHVPVWYHCTPQHKAEIECPYHKYELGGHIFYVEADADITKNPEYVDVINRIAWANDCGYSSINHTQGRCEDCNYESNDPNLHRFGSVCPNCGGKWSTLDRVTGYLSSTYSKQSFGKKAEILDRIVHKS